MALRYRYRLDQAADEMIGTLALRGQRVLRDCFRALSEHPFTVGDQQVMDEAGRTNQVRRVDRFVVTYWADHAAREMRIVAVELF